MSTLGLGCALRSAGLNNLYSLDTLMNESVYCNLFIHAETYTNEIQYHTSYQFKVLEISNESRCGWMERKNVRENTKKYQIRAEYI